MKAQTENKIVKAKTMIRIETLEPAPVFEDADNEEEEHAHHPGFNMDDEDFEGIVD